jgi:hypothetical protein
MNDREVADGSEIQVFVPTGVSLGIGRPTHDSLRRSEFLGAARLRMVEMPSPPLERRGLWAVNGNQHRRMCRAPFIQSDQQIGDDGALPGVLLVS